ncbi:calcium activated cation channel [Daedalea quercina L-15889]|uniref:Calcium activated cation channel n=1 Tax=Daedalea quercina L-15889 TaxID=1314783 RepID=A0A165S2T5_9APHY|nr:calcium activated cation channel [Daedalea quercina L-15889]
MSDQRNGDAEDDRTGLLPSICRDHPEPETITNLIKRVRALTLRLLPIEVPPESIEEPTSRVITPQVIDTYTQAAGDFVQALPYALLRARKEFMWDANTNPADYGENLGRAVACEVLARRVVHQAPPDKTVVMLSTRFRFKEVDNGNSEKASALELAIDSHCTIFLSSTEAQDVVNCLWRGQLVQKHEEDHDIDFVPYKQSGYDSFWAHLDAGRLSVPRYQNIFRIVVWILFLFAYSLAVREPLDKLDSEHSELDFWEVVMYVLGLAFSVDDLHKLFKLLLFVSWRTLGFWDVVSVTTDSLLTVAFVLRMAGIVSAEPQSSTFRLRAFQCLSFVAPLIWMKVIPVFDGFQFVGTMQICVARMLKESGIFFGLLALLGIGFLQGLYALDAADGHNDHPYEVVHVLIQALLQSPNYDMFSGSTSGQWLYYGWNVATAVVLVNVLISLFSSAYNDVIEDAAAEYLTYFAGKVGGMIRAPDEYVYPAPFNIVEVLLVAPLEFVVSKRMYDRVNRCVMMVLFFIPLCTIALYEAELDPAKNRWIRDLLSHPDEGGEDTPEFEDPGVHPADHAKGLEISKVPFEELVKVFPDMTRSNEAVMLNEMEMMKEQIKELKELLLAKQ